MPCDTRLAANQTLKQRMAEVSAALEKLKRSLLANAAKVVIAPNGAVTFAGWTDRAGISDACAYRTLAASSSWELRQAVSRAEAASGRKVNANAIAAGWHSHTGGKTWDRH